MICIILCLIRLFFSRPSPLTSGPAGMVGEQGLPGSPGFDGRFGITGFEGPKGKLYGSLLEKTSA